MCYMMPVAAICPQAMWERIYITHMGGGDRHVCVCVCGGGGGGGLVAFPREKIAAEIRY